MNRRRTENRVTWLLTMVALITLLPPAAAPHAHADGTWTNKTRSPSERDGHAMAYLGGGQVLLFGGLRPGGFDDETWVYSLGTNTWTEQAPAAKVRPERSERSEWAAPSARADHAMAYLGGDQVLLFGGNDGDWDGETWVYDLSDNTWTDQAPAAAPSARFKPAMALLGANQVLLFGGHDAGGYNGETWLATGFFSPFRVYLPMVMRNY